MRIILNTPFNYFFETAIKASAPGAEVVEAYFATIHEQVKSPNDLLIIVPTDSNNLKAMVERAQAAGLPSHRIAILSYTATDLSMVSPIESYKAKGIANIALPETPKDMANLLARYF